MAKCKGADLNWPSVGCCYGDDQACQCGDDERPLRAYIAGRVAAPMTPQQREFCLQEIEKVEGHRREDYAGDDDADLARGVLNAWRDYCRDLGML